MNQEAPLASFEFRRGGLAGSHLSLFNGSLVHRSADRFEAIPLDRIGALGIGFERDTGRISFGWVLAAIAVVLLAAYLPLRAIVGSALAEAAAQTQGSEFLLAGLKALDLCIALMPGASGVVALWAVASLVFGWVGETVLRVTIAPAERTFSSRGRDKLLYEFAETVAARIARRD